MIGKVGSLSRLGLRWNSTSTFLTPTIEQVVSKAKIGESVVACGHIRSCRRMKNMTFVDIADGASSTIISITMKGDSFITENKLSVGQSVEIRGEWVYSDLKNDAELICNPDSKSDHYMKVIGTVPPRYPIQKKQTSLEFLRTLPTLRHRTRTLGQVLRTRSFIEGSLFKFFQNEGFIKVTPPEISSSDCEGAGELFQVDSQNKKKFFKKNVFLTVSTQLHLEVLSAALNRVWTLTPCFRAEDSDTNRHLSEFWMLEAEINYVNDVSQLTNLCENMLRQVAKDMIESKHVETQIQNSYKNDQLMELLRKRIESFLSNENWPIIKYKQALEVLNEHNNADLVWGDSISTEHEKWLAGTYYKSPVFVTDYPKSQKPFYMKNSTNFDPKFPTVACFDLLVPDIGELIGGSLRIHDYDELVNEIRLRNMDLKSMEWYTSLRRNGTVPHGGFGLGFERLVMLLTGMDNIRDVIPFPRFPENCKC